MTAFAMALVAGMAVGSDGTGRISPEIVEPLCIDGYWEGIVQAVIDGK